MFKKLNSEKIGERHSIHENLKKIGIAELELLGLIISSIRSLNSMFVLLPIQQQFYQQSTPGEPVTKFLSWSLVFRCIFWA